MLLLKISTKQSHKNNALALFNCFHKFASQKSIYQYCKILNISPNYTQEQLKNAYLEMVKKHHPDLSKEPNARQKFQDVQQAYDALQKQNATSMNKNENLNPKSSQASTSHSKFKQQFHDTYSRKKHADQSMQFSYNLFKKHHENISEEKKKYKKYASKQGKDDYYREDEPVESWSKTIWASAALLGVIGGALWVVNAK